MVVVCVYVCVVVCPGLTTRSKVNVRKTGESCRYAIHYNLCHHILLLICNEVILMAAMLFTAINVE